MSDRATEKNECTHGIAQSRLYSGKNFYRSFKEDLRDAKQKVIIESPLMSEARTRGLLPILKKLRKRGVKVVINNRNPYHHDYLLRNQGFIASKLL